MGDGGSKQLFVDGKLVGEVPITGNLEKDLEAATELMKAKGVYRQLTAPQVMFGQAAAFAGTAAHLFNNDLLQVPRRNAASLGPFVVNAAFAVELYLKALNRLYDNDVGRTHDLLQLFSALPDAAKQAISLEFDRATSRPSTMTNLSAFQAEIERVRHAFMDWRYLHERTRTDEVRIQELIFVHNVLRFDARVNPNASDQV